MAENQVSTNKFSCAKWIVDTNGVSAGATHSTIASALTSAVSGETIFIRPGTYTEDLTLKAGVNIASYAGEMYGQVKIAGKLTCTFSGLVVLTGLVLNTSGDNAISMTGSNSCTLRCLLCEVSAGDSNIPILLNNANASLKLHRCTGDPVNVGIKYIDCTAGSVSIRYSIIGTGSSVTASTFAAGSHSILYSQMQNMVTTSGTAAINIQHTTMGGVTNVIPLILGGSGTNNIRYSFFVGGTASCITCSAGTNNIYHCSLSSSNTNVIDGAGSISYAGLVFVGSSSNISTTTQAVLSEGPNRILSGTGHLTVPTGTAAQQPGSPVEGMLRGNSDEKRVEYYTGSIWVPQCGINGTFTPVIKFGGLTTGITYTTQTGKYQRVGDLVFININIHLSNKGSDTGAATITGIPVSATSNSFPLTWRSTGLTFVTVPIFRIQGTTINCEEVASAGSTTTLQETDFTNTTRVQLSGSYFIA